MRAIATLPAGASMKVDGEGNAGAASYAGLAAGATAEFAIQVAAAAHNGERFARNAAGCG